MPNTVKTEAALKKLKTKHVNRQWNVNSATTTSNWLIGSNRPSSSAASTSAAPAAPNGSSVLTSITTRAISETEKKISSLMQVAEKLKNLSSYYSEGSHPHKRASTNESKRREGRSGGS